MKDSRMNTYNRLPVDLVKGQGARVWDTEGREYLDALAGIAVCSLGHAHPEVAEALCEQARTLVHCTNLYDIPVQRQLADKLCALSGMDNVFFGNSGAEANEAAIKIARLYGHQNGIDDPVIVVTEGAFHGRTLATLTATGNRKVQAGFEPLVHGFVRAAYDNLEAIGTIADNTPNVVAVLVEPVQGEGGVNIPDPGYLNGLRELCDRHGWLLMLDEIQTGMCRTGKWFAYQHNAIMPDIVTLAKSLGNGMPISACLAHGKAAQVFQPGNHGSTYGGNPLACRTALKVVELMERDRIAERAAELGEKMLADFVRLLANTPGITEIRGKGMMIGIELQQDCGALVGAALQRGLLINVTAGNTIRLLPPLILSDDEAKTITSGVCELIQQFVDKTDTA